MFCADCKATRRKIVNDGLKDMPEGYENAVVGIQFAEFLNCAFASCTPGNASTCRTNYVTAEREPE